MARITEQKRIYKHRTEDEMRQALQHAIHGRVRMCVPPDDEDTDIVLYDMFHELLEWRVAAGQAHLGEEDEKLLVPRLAPLKEQERLAQLESVKGA